MTTMTMDDTARTHLSELRMALTMVDTRANGIASWGERLAAILGAGGRLLAAGNGGSAAQAHHLVAELVGKLDGDRPPLSAIALSAETCGLTAIGNDYGFEHIYARQVIAHARAGDVVMLLSTSGGSTNVLAAAEAARKTGAAVWAMTGAAPNPLAETADESFVVPSRDTQIVQEMHLVAVHLLCGYVDEALENLPAIEAMAVAADRHDVGGSRDGDRRDGA
jgi:D-sedoheptulose 7-phosphate isomerase